MTTFLDTRVNIVISGSLTGYAVPAVESRSHLGTQSPTNADKKTFGDELRIVCVWAGGHYRQLHPSGASAPNLVA